VHAAPRILALCASVAALACASVTLAACGSSSSAAVARVGGTSITKATLAHWMAIKRGELDGRGGVGAPTPSEAEVREKALRFLITSQWLQQEAAARGIAVAASDTEAFYAHLLSSSSGSQFAAGLKRRGLSRADELLVLRIGELAEKLRAQLTAPLRGAPASAIRHTVSAFIVAYRERWRQRTTCEPGYVIAECRNGPPRVASVGASK
jgi:hypothetical protein